MNNFLIEMINLPITIRLNDTVARRRYHCFAGVNSYMSPKSMASYSKLT